MKTLMTRLLALLLVVIILAGCAMVAEGGIPGAAGDRPPNDAYVPTIGPRLSLVSRAKCLDASDGPITIWHLGETNTPLYTCAPQVIVSLDEMAIGYDPGGYIISLDEVYTLIDGLGQVYTKQEILDGEWPDTLWPTDESESYHMRGPL